MARTSQMLRRYVREHKLLHRHLYPAFTIVPEIERTCVALHAFIGTNFRGYADPLLYEMLLEGGERFTETRRNNGRPVIEFMRGVFSHAHLLFFSRYIAVEQRTGTLHATWEPMSEPIPVFEARNEGYPMFNKSDVRAYDSTSKTAAFFLAARVLSVQSFRYYFETQDVAGYFSHYPPLERRSENG